MTNLCRDVQHYNICIKHFQISDYLYQIRGCAELSNTVANYTTQRQSVKSTEFTLRFGDQNSMQGNYHIEMNQNGSFARLFGPESSFDFMQNADVCKIFDFVQIFSPRHVRVLNMICPNSLLQQHNSCFLPASIEQYSISNWSIFNGVTCLIDNRIGSVVHLDKMIFPNSNQAELIGQRVISRDTSISKFKLTNSLFYPDVLPKMLKFPKIDSLIFDSCIFMTNSRYQLEISLPETKLGYLELNLDLIFHSNSLKRPSGHYTIVLSTGTSNIATYTFNINEDKAYQKDSSKHGTLENFFIYVKCQDLESLNVSGKKIF